MLAWVIGRHWHALVRDVLALGYRAKDILTTLTLAEMVAIVTAAPPTSSVRFFLEGGWSREAHLLANMQEGNAGLAKLSEPYQRPGAQQETGLPAQPGKYEVMTWDEMDRRNIERYTRADELARQGIKPTNTRVRTL